MSLKKVTLKNFRTCHDVELNDLGHLTVLMGRNGVGKTTILQGIEWMARTASTQQDDFPFRESTDFLGEMEFSIAGVGYRYHIELLASFEFYEKLDEHLKVKEKLEYLDSSMTWHTVLSRSGQKVFGSNGEPLAEIHEYMPMLVAIAALIPTSHSHTKNNILPVLGYLRSFKYYPLDETADVYRLVSRVDYLQWLAKTTESSNPESSVIMRVLNLYLDRRDDFDELEQLLGANGLGVINSINVESLEMASSSPSSSSRHFGRAKSIFWPTSSLDYRTCYFIDFLPGEGWEGVIDLPKLTYNNLSAGTRRIIRILVSFFYDRNSLFLFEQPEDAIHPGLLRKLIDLLRGYDDKGQLIMTSHSSDLFDVLKPEEVRLVTMESGATQVRALSEKELDSAKRYINEGGSLSDFLEMLEDD